eukprot:365753-Chlamydomonas_euryale.AAC.4
MNGSSSSRSSSSSGRGGTTITTTTTTSTTTAPPPLPLPLAPPPTNASPSMQLLKRLGDNVRVDLVDRLPTPFGLVRSGVAPDHQVWRRWRTRGVGRGAGAESGKEVRGVEVLVPRCTQTHAGCREHHEAVCCGRRGPLNLNPTHPCPLSPFSLDLKP